MDKDELEAVLAAILAAGTLSQHANAAEAVERYRVVLAEMRAGGGFRKEKTP